MSSCILLSICACKSGSLTAWLISSGTFGSNVSILSFTHSAWPSTSNSSGTASKRRAASTAFAAALRWSFSTFNLSAFSSGDVVGTGPFLRFGDFWRASVTWSAASAGVLISPRGVEPNSIIDLIVSAVNAHMPSWRRRRRLTATPPHDGYLSNSKKYSERTWSGFGSLIISGIFLSTTTWSIKSSINLILVCSGWELSKIPRISSASLPSKNWARCSDIWPMVRIFISICCILPNSWSGVGVSWKTLALAAWRAVSSDCPIAVRRSYSMTASCRFSCMVWR